MNQDLGISSIRAKNWQMAAITLAKPDDLLVVPVVGIVGNSITTSAVGKQRTRAWKVKVTSSVKHARGVKIWNPHWQYAITIGCSFCLALHGNQPLDVENYLKPSIDALAAGLFSSDEQDSRSIQRYNYDDSNFKYLFVYRLPDAQIASEEGAAFCVSVQRN